MIGHRCRTVAVATSCVVAGVWAAVVPVSASAVEGQAVPATALFVVDDPDINESSGVAVGASGRVLWTHEDANNQPLITALDSTGQTLAQFELLGVANEDWEDIAVATVDGTPYVYVADTGDAFFIRRDAEQPARTTFEIARVAEPDVDTPPDERQLEAEVTSVVFPDEAQVNVEALAVAPDGSLTMVEKIEPLDPPDEEQEGEDADAEPAPPPPAPDPARVWRVMAPEWGGTSRPEVISQLPLVGVSGADIDRSGTSFAVRTADTASVFPYDGEQPVFEVVTASVALPSQPQGEAVAFTAEGNALVVGSEGSRQAMWYVPLVPGLTPGLRPPPVEIDAGAGPAVGDGAAVADTSALGQVAVVAGIIVAFVIGRAVRSGRRRPWIESGG